MEIGQRKPTGREKDEASIKLLNRLRGELYSQHASNRRQAAFNLSWMQEDGLEILQAALYGQANVTTKNAAAYGLRNMRGRMKKMAMKVLKEGLEHSSSDTREVCRSALLRLEGKLVNKPPSKSKKRKSKYQIKDIPRGPRGNRQKRTVGMMRSQNRRRPMGNKRSSRD